MAPTTAGGRCSRTASTIESVLNRHLSELLGEEIHVIGASRTDSGVHADGNVAVFDTNRLAHAGRADLLCDEYTAPGRISASRIPVRCRSDFHPRFPAVQ